MSYRDDVTNELFMRIMVDIKHVALFWPKEWKNVVAHRLTDWLRDWAKDNEQDDLSIDITISKEVVNE